MPYEARNCEEARQILTVDATFALAKTWWHATYASRLDSVLRFGLLPACWFGGDTCAVFGLDDLGGLPSWRTPDWLIEVHSSALPGPAKAWWVAPGAIRGGWFRGNFVPRLALLQASDLEPTAGQQPDGCACVLSDVCREQQNLWRASLTAHGPAL